MEPSKVLKNKKVDGVGIKTGLCPGMVQRRMPWPAKAVAKPLLNSLRGGGRSLDFWRLRLNTELFKLESKKTYLID